MREASGFDMLNEKLRGLLNREQETLSKEEELEERLNKGNLSEEEIVQIYEEIVEQVESEELEFRNILELEEEEFQEAIKASKREVKLRRKKFEVILDFEENINQLKVTAENLTENFSQEVFEEFLYHHNQIKSDKKEVEELEQHEQLEVDVEELEDLALESKEAWNQLKKLVDHLQQETSFLSQTSSSAEEDTREVEKCRRILQKISNSEHHIEQLKEEIENIENLHQDQEKAKEVYIAFKQNKSDLEELESILSEKEFIMKAYKGVSTEEGERRVEEMGGVRNTVAGLKEMHLEISKRFNKWGAEIATMSRRDYLKVSGLIAGGFATGTYGAFTAENIWDQIESGQFQPFEFVSAAHHKSIEKAVRGETVPVYLIQILFDEADNISLNWRGIIESAEREFERSLDIDLNIEYLSLELDLDKLIVTNPGERWRQQQRELKEVILEGDVNEGAESAEVSGGDVSKTHQYVLGQLGNYKPVRELPDDAIIAAFSDFARGGGVATVRPENGILMNNYGNQISFRDTFVHEIGHKFGLPHAAVAPHDVMSYSEIRDYSNELGEERGFTFESKFNWSRAKRKVRE